MTEVRPSRFEIARIVRRHYIEHERGMTRAELGAVVGWKGKGRIPGLAAAIDERLIRYDYRTGDTLVPYGIVER